MKINPLIISILLIISFSFSQNNWDEIDSLIILNRTQNLNIIVKDSVGNPLQNSEIHISQLNHHYSFGTCISGHYGTFEDSIQTQYEDTLKKYFNSTVDEWSFKWPIVEPSQDDLNFGPSDEKYNWSIENNMPMRGHTIFWANYAKVPSWARDLPNDELIVEMKEHIQDVVSRYDEMDEFDINNEMILNNYFRERFGDSIIDSMFTWSLEVKPNAKFYLNEYGIINSVLLDLYIDQINLLQSQNIPIGGIGIQGHIFTSDEPTDMGTFAGDTVFSPIYLWNVIDELIQFDLPIKITEFDFNAPDDSTHAEWLVNFYKVMFAHPAMEGVVAWGFWEEVHWRPEGAMFDIDFNPKPSALAYYDLVYSQWWIDENFNTNHLGFVNTNLFYGEHQIDISYNNINYQFSLNVENVENSDIEITLPIIIEITECIMGDVNCDSNINVIDVLIIVDFILENEMPLPTQFENSNLNFDDELNVIDVLLLVELILY